jgi:hypothetical protein
MQVAWAMLLTVALVCPSPMISASRPMDKTQPSSPLVLRCVLAGTVSIRTAATGEQRSFRILSLYTHIAMVSTSSIL